MAAGIVAIVATFISFVIGIRVLGWEPGQVWCAIGASNIAAWCCLPVTLLGERVPWFKKYVIPGMLRTWAFFAAVYFAVFLALARDVREPHAFVWMVLPLMYTTGYMIFVYGPIHDFFVRRAQVRARARARAS
jgi:hypothetical protein